MDGQVGGFDGEDSQDGGDEGVWVGSEIRDIVVQDLFELLDVQNSNSLYHKLPIPRKHNF